MESTRWTGSGISFWNFEEERVGWRSRVEERMGTESFVCSPDSFRVSTMYLIKLYIYIYICVCVGNEVYEFIKLYGVSHNSVFICNVSLSCLFTLKDTKFSAVYMCDRHKVCKPRKIIEALYIPSCLNATIFNTRNRRDEVPKISKRPE
jgi:hypothetical protein